MLKLPHLFPSDLNRIKDLCSNKVPESQIIDYKRELPGRTDKDKRAFLADVTSMMNAIGGKIVYGIVEANAHASSLNPIKHSQMDSIIRDLSQIIESGVRPRVEYNFNQIKVDGEHSVLELIIPPSEHAPHMITLGGYDKFYMRVGTQNSPMSVDSIKNKCQEVDYYQKSHAQKYIKLANMFNGEFVTVHGATFESCVLDGPMNVVLSGGELRGNIFREVEVILLKENAFLKNVILFEDCIIRDCSISNVMFLMTKRVYMNSFDANMRAQIRVIATESA